MKARVAEAADEACAAFQRLNDGSRDSMPTRRDAVAFVQAISKLSVALAMQLPDDEEVADE